jgi:hypothetical protein
MWDKKSTIIIGMKEPLHDPFSVRVKSDED